MHLKAYSSELKMHEVSLQRELHRIVLVVMPGSSSLEVSLAIQAFKTANAIAGYNAFFLRIATMSGEGHRHGRWVYVTDLT